MRNFRIWDKTSKRWDTDLALLPNGNIIDISECFWNIIDDKWQSSYVVQFNTGILDRKGKEVHEGDIIVYSRLLERERIIKDFRSEIIFKNGNFGYYLTGYNDMFFSLDGDSDVEVIGNIFGNLRPIK